MRDEIASRVSLAKGPHALSIPGPSMAPERVLRAMHRPSPNIYQGPLIEMTHSLFPDLKRVARTEHHATIYIGNGHAAWEACLANTHSRGDLVLIPKTGSFADGWATMAEGLGLRTEIMDFGNRGPIDPAAVGERLRADKGHEIRSVLMVHVDTSSSVRSDAAALRRELDAAGHPALLQADCIASMGCDRFEMDEWGVDVAVTGCQKGLMTPPGLAFVFYNDKADRARERADCVTGYWDWRPRTNPEVYFRYFNGTAPTHHLYGLREALDMIHEEGMEAVWARHAALARAVWAALEAWERDGPLEMNVRDAAHRSHAVTSVRLPERGTELRTWCEEQFGLTLGIGVGMAPMGSPEWDGFFRIGHMGHVNGHVVMGTLGGIEAGLDALGVPHGPGGLSAAAKALAQA
ncbi:pyridoxal-phosphate-dependent aminotransferase family protein [Jannaschia seohaensis]|uniref:Alanine-glyoxylate transaminase / serine-glyoxylate transaminase / serine-pyruvate transaminase n=1 Tax=Jannaschia seohaensis TaxID=475081 RepID=A0A2Y9AYG5_9RHOB|nr:aminotransferase class V-fold PLP-dependent enzyme [Jannaschia seohaensis]PWJ16243.1 alanine-glyoxylate transaminase/serine-glyoxylate transaminase/serine-pyruvate transaminase [Jannaschia seohaensis]SSA49314.1 alanine-glyoxylate transaminase / serine-glyoxylate transaminase / serine-pyruvate transaminase [Jannaschia seohaensis]